VAATRAALGDEVFDAAFTEGRRTTLETVGPLVEKVLTE
jgi:hypothetical protein